MLREPAPSRLLTSTSRNRFQLTPLALVAWALVHGGAAWAQAAGDAPTLRSSPMLREQLPPEQRSQMPTFVQGDRLTGRTDFETIVEGSAELRRGETVIKADRLEYFQPDDLAKARGNVRINRQGNIYQGPQLELHVDAFEGFFNQPSYEFLRNGAYGQAERVDFIDDSRSVVRNATYTTCRPEDLPGWMPDWIMRAGSIRLDNEEEVGTATDALLTFFSVPVLPIPKITFPLSEKRRSGFLPPTFGVDSINGIEYRQPYYWDIAPNRDMTLYPRVMSKRGVELGGEFRYLEPGYRGQIQANVLPGDKLRDRLRWGYAARHDGILLANPDIGQLNLNLNLNRVSDDNYWRDFTRTSGSLTQRLLASDALLSWGRGYWTASARTLRWQTLQDATAPITPPYDRLPTLAARYARPDLALG
ncbi:MAG: LPS-assembly protein LptD, partial [Comamonadaceae bacterium]